MGQPNLGARKLREWRAAQKLSLTKASRLFDCDPSALHHLEHGTTTPKLDTARKLRDVAGISVDDWSVVELGQAATRKRLPRSMSARK